MVTENEVKSEIPEEEMALLRAVDEAIIRAGVIMEMGDIPEDTADDDYDSMYEERFHCGKCIVSTVMTEIWDDLSRLMDYYENREPKEKA